MKQLLKSLGWFFLAIVIGWLLIIFLANYVFTKKLYLSCNGSWEVVDASGGKQTVEKFKSTESLVITITSYPFLKPIFLIQTGRNLLSSTDDFNISLLSSINDQSIWISKEIKVENKAVIKNSFSLNRITLNVNFQEIVENIEANFKTNSEFTGACKTVKPI
jgi:hypothetical protein